MEQRHHQKVLIIKPGYSETLDPDTSGEVSLGDVMRSTVLLHCFPQESFHVTWLVDERSWPMLRGNGRIDRVLILNQFTPFHLMREFFDIVINLEKDPGICALADNIPAGQRCGFRFDPRRDCVAGHLQSNTALELASDPLLKRSLRRNWSEILFEMVGRTWQGENILLGHYPAKPPSFDIGINYRAGRKYPLKVWPMAQWQGLAERLGDRGLSVSWQPAQDNLDEFETYIDWINDCRVLVSADSLAVHIAAGLEKPTVALFGPTLPSDIPDRPHLVKIWSPQAHDCPPCQSRTCVKDRQCMTMISADEVEQHVLTLLEEAPPPPARRSRRSRRDQANMA